MHSESEKAEVQFELPYTPYPNQLIFMKDAYKCFEESRFGLFESPTGSGKTLSILCSALTWLKNNRAKTLMCNLNFDKINDESVPKWVSESAFGHRRMMVEDILRNEDLKLENLRKKILEWVDNSDGNLRIRNNFKRLPPEASDEDVTEVNGEVNKTQVVICSRTFSQLNQYVKEFKKLESLNKNLKLSIGCGRSHVCIHGTVKIKCKSSEELNDECRRSKCEFRSNVNDLANLSTCYPLDLEDLVRFGSELESCPYYSNLNTISNSDVILAPYVTIINESLRESLGIRIKGNILIFDEGHNLNDAITESHSCKLTLLGLKELNHQINGYSKKYKINSNPLISNRTSEIAKFTTSIAEFVEKIDQDLNMKITSFTLESRVEEVKFHEILNFLTSTDFCRHLRGFAEREYHVKKKEDPGLVSHTSSIYLLKNFIYSLLYCDSNDQVIITPLEGDVAIEIFPVASVEESKSVIVMSGTLSPIEEFLCLVPEKMEPFIHKSPPVFEQNRFFASILDQGEYFECIFSDGEELVYDYGRRSDERHLEFLSQFMEQMSQIVPGGIVCFFSSYSYLDTFFTFFTKSNHYHKVVEKKSVFVEKRTSKVSYFAGTVNIFPQYAKECLERGAILLAVFGGSQSEGVDFADDLARLVILVGIPYPPDDVKLRLKREYYKSRSLSSVSGEGERYLKMAREQRTLLCYKRINQCIGRAMRHKNDYSAVILLDSRYKSREAGEYLANFVKKSINVNKGKDLIPALKAFYKRLS